MNKFDGHRLGIAQGSLLLFSDYKDGGVMWTGHGPREMRRRVIFAEAYRGAPAVQVSLSMWDIDAAHNGRMDISTDVVTREGFDIVFRTWGDSRVARVRADWLAIGPVAHADDWMLD
ncbi:H-type lectin domain-containing protein [Pontitalea aquivivens]|uniref:H-type lectin domain-containing protein n=1 Tax=Pontitalea aquivivens TaxID=3388663 RepID=UPI003970A790